MPCVTEIGQTKAQTSPISPTRNQPCLICFEVPGTVFCFPFWGDQIKHDQKMQMYGNSDGFPLDSALFGSVIQ